MTDTLVTTKHKPRRALVSNGYLSAPNSVRAFRASPEDVVLQIRREKDYVSVSLTFEEARQIAEALLSAVELQP